MVSGMDTEERIPCSSAWSLGAVNLYGFWPPSTRLLRLLGAAEGAVMHRATKEHPGSIAAQHLSSRYFYAAGREAGRCAAKVTVRSRRPCGPPPHLSRIN
jgi:hypothetical protein